MSPTCIVGGAPLGGILGDIGDHLLDGCRRPSRVGRRRKRRLGLFGPRRPPVRRFAITNVARAVLVEGNAKLPPFLTMLELSEAMRQVEILFFVQLSVQGEGVDDIANQCASNHMVSDQK